MVEEHNGTKMMKMMVGVMKIIEMKMKITNLY